VWNRPTRKRTRPTSSRRSQFLVRPSFNSAWGSEEFPRLTLPGGSEARAAIWAHFMDHHISSGARSVQKDSTHKYVYGGGPVAPTMCPFRQLSSVTKRSYLRGFRATRVARAGVIWMRDVAGLASSAVERVLTDTRVALEQARLMNRILANAVPTIKPVYHVDSGKTDKSGTLPVLARTAQNSRNTQKTRMRVDMMN